MPLLGPNVYIIDVECFKPPEEYRCHFDEFFEAWRKTQRHTEEEMAFFEKVFHKSGLSRNATFLPPAIHPVLCEGQAKTDLDSAALECRMAVNGAVEGLLKKTGLKSTDIDILVTTCSIYCPCPSMASMVINHFKMRQDIQSYHMGGMGCSNGVVGINLVKDLLQAWPNTNALFVTTEVTTPAYYPGQDRHRQVTNALFRMGAAAILLSNKSSWGRHVKYQLEHSYRVHVGQADDAFMAIHYTPDSQGINGVYLGKNVVVEASRALTQVMWQVGPKVLSWQEQARYLYILLLRRLGRSVPTYNPTFSGSIQHFALHAGGAKVLDGLGKALQLSERDLEPSRAVLHDYGNVSASTTWYTLAFIESVRGFKRGDRLLQIGVGSGIKCGVNVWKACHDVRDVHTAWEHCVSEADRARYQRPPRLHVDVSHVSRHLASRVLFMCIMLLLVGTMHFYMMSVASTHGLGEADYSGGHAICAPPSSGGFKATATAEL